jgi:hypothetical protein
MTPYNPYSYPQYYSWQLGQGLTEFQLMLRTLILAPIVLIAVIILAVGIVKIVKAKKEE